MFGRDSGDSTVLCPFDNTHVILAKSFNSHLVRCRKNNQHLKKVPCKFDRTHMILKPELQHHHNVCPSRLLLDRELQIRSAPSNTLHGNVTGPEITAAYIEDTEEDWDAGPKYTATNALFYNKKHFDEEEEEAVSGYNPSSAAPSYSSSASSLGGRGEQEEAFRKKPLAPSKAAQLSAPTAGVRPQSSSSQVYQYSLQQAALGRGRGRGVSTAKPTSDVRPGMANVEGVNSGKATAALAPHLGRGIARYASNIASSSHPGSGLSQQVGVTLNSAPANVNVIGAPFEMAARPGESRAATGVVHATSVTPQELQNLGSAWSQQYQQQQQQQTNSTYINTTTTTLPVSRFDDIDDVETQLGGTSSSIPVQNSVVAGGVEASLGLEEELKNLLLQERLQNQREMEELRQAQERRHQQLMNKILEKQMQSVQAIQQPSLTNVASVCSAPPGFGAVSDSLVDPAMPGAGRGLGVKTNSKPGIPEMNMEQLSKERKKMEKKLRQIKDLEEKRASGETLSAEEEAKIKKKNNILRDLETVNLHL